MQNKSIFLCPSMVKIGDTDAGVAYSGFETTAVACHAESCYKVIIHATIEC
jgi:hypothetical protein